MNNSHSRGRTSVRWLIVVGVLAASVSALASNFGSYYANGALHSFHYNGLSAAWADEATWVRANEIGPTVMSTTLTAHDFSDVSVTDANYGDTNWCGFSSCISDSTQGVCTHWHTKFNTSDGVGCPNAYTTAQRRHLACHEFGHTVGLKHRGDTAASCMITSSGGPLGSQTHYDSHDRSHINSKY